MKLAWRRDRNIITWHGIVNQSKWWTITKDVIFILSVAGFIYFIIFGPFIYKEDINEKVVNSFRNINIHHIFR